jgi:predicted phosphodiesterase
MNAVISDIHGNLEALDAVLDAIQRLDATRIICLGDLVAMGQILLNVYGVPPLGTL